MIQKLPATTTPSLLCLLCVAVAACGGAPAAPLDNNEPTLLEVRLEAPAPESPAGQMFEVPLLSHREVMDQIRSAGAAAPCCRSHGGRNAAHEGFSASS